MIVRGEVVPVHEDVVDSLRNGTDGRTDGKKGESESGIEGHAQQ